MEKLDCLKSVTVLRSVTKYMYQYLKGMTQQEMFCDMKETLVDSALAYATAAK